MAVSLASHRMIAGGAIEAGAGCFPRMGHFALKQLREAGRGGYATAEVFLFTTVQTAREFPGGEPLPFVRLGNVIKISSQQSEGHIRGRGRGLQRRGSVATCGGEQSDC